MSPLLLVFDFLWQLHDRAHRGNEYEVCGSWISTTEKRGLLSITYYDCLTPNTNIHRRSITIQGLTLRSYQSHITVSSPCSILPPHLGHGRSRVSQRITLESRHTGHRGVTSCTSPAGSALLPTKTSTSSSQSLQTMVSTTARKPASVPPETSAE